MRLIRIGSRAQKNRKRSVLLRSNMITDEGWFPWLRHVTQLQSHRFLIEPPMYDEGSDTQTHPSMAAVVHDLEL